MQRSKVQGSTWLALLLLVSLQAFCPAQEPDAAWRVWLEPKFMRAPVSKPVDGSKKTDFAAGQLVNGALEPATRDAFEKLGVTWEAFDAKARENAAAELASLKPEYIRNRRKVIEYAVIRSEQPFVSSAVLAPGFLKLFEETLGPKVLVVVPSRYVAIVFPALATNYRDYAPLVFREYRASAFPVSVEVFEFSAEGIRTIGAYEEP